MAEKVKVGDFIELDYIGRIKSGRIFDLTLVDVAKKEGIFQENQKYKPLIISLGAEHLLKGLELAIEGKEIGQEFEVELPPEQAFGKRNPKLIQLTSLATFKKKGLTPAPGLQFSIDGALATIRSVSGGRVIVDFNHPLAGKTLHYWVRINRKVEKVEEKIASLVNLLLNQDSKVEINEKIKIELESETNPKLLEALKTQIQKLVSEVDEKEIQFETKKKE